MTQLFVKYMVSQRCKMMVKSELQRLGLHYYSVDLGMAEILEEISPEERNQLAINLKRSGLELLDDKRSVIVEKIQLFIKEMIHDSQQDLKVNYSDYLSEKLGYDYTYLSTIFSEVNGITIQHFIILNKIEHVKELLIYDKLSLSEISFLMNYSSAAHLSNQFKKITGLTPSFYRQLQKKRNQNLANL